VIELASTPDVGHLVYCDAAGCRAWEHITDARMPGDWIAVLETRPGTVVRMLAFCSWQCVRQLAGTHGQGQNP